MKMSFSADQEAMRQNIERMVKRDVVPKARQIDEKDEVPVDQLKIFAGMGLFSIFVPQKYGGLGGGLTDFCIAMEEVAKGSSACAGYILGQGFGGLALRFGGTEEQKERYYPEVMKDASFAFALTEPQGGSDLGGIQTKGVLSGDHYIVNGRKVFITNGGNAKYYLTLVKTEQNGSKGLSLLLIERGTEGFAVGKQEKKMGFRGAPFTELIFEDAKVPKGQLLYKFGKGLQLCRRLLSYTRTGVAAWAMGNAEGALENAIDYIKLRPQFGEILSNNQAIRFMVAEMITKIELSRSLIFRVASLVDSGVTDVIPLASMAKLFSTDMGMEITTKCVQMLGAYGYTQEFPVERMMRDAKGFQIFEGANEIQKIIIAKTFLD